MHYDLVAGQLVTKLFFMQANNYINDTMEQLSYNISIVYTSESEKELRLSNVHFRSSYSPRFGSDNFWTFNTVSSSPDLVFTLTSTSSKSFAVQSSGIFISTNMRKGALEIAITREPTSLKQKNLQYDYRCVYFYPLCLI